MDAKATVSLPGMVLGWSGFSANSMIRLSSLTAITPKALASSMGTGIEPTVMSAPAATWAAIILP